MAKSPRMLIPAPPTYPAMPPALRLRTLPEGPADAGFAAGAALASLHAMAIDEHPIGSLWRDRLALTSAAALMGFLGRTEDEAALRDAVKLTRPGDDPGPGGKVLIGWRRLVERRTLLADDRWLTASAVLQLPIDDRLHDVYAVAERLAKGEGNPVAAAAEIVAVTMKFRPDAELLALWLADAIVASRLKWLRPVPLLAAEIKRKDLRSAPDHLNGDGRWPITCAAAYARAAARASDLHADLCRKAARLLEVAPKLRNKHADTVLLVLLMEDAQTARSATDAISERSARRLFERLETLGAVRELTGRSTFRLYGL
ncbi:hypothetical protein C5748_10820 [Phyllobacterium phragmitis]|uniref:DUF1403 domain-containing protein n=2 Tax=Phyllobacterium phragmitis TaxID=2670329 RepID=A0A2S9IT73_9HYPH|nr:hypothetical protein C5748_10820 [Phyllobacterium phragmitis]